MKVIKCGIFAVFVSDFVNEIGAYFDFIAKLSKFSFVRKNSSFGSFLRKLSWCESESV